MALEVSRSTIVPAAPATVWADIVDPEAFAQWFAFCDAAHDPMEGSRILQGSWGSQRSTVEVEVVRQDPPSRFTYRHVSELLDGRPAPRMSIDTQVDITLTPTDGGTEVEITSCQEPANMPARVMMRLVGKRQLGGMLEQSLTLLAARHATG